MKWISRIQSKADSPCRHIFEQYISRKYIDLNILLHSDFCIKTLEIDKRKIPPFCIETLTLWSQIGNTYPADKNFFLWYNRDITVNNISVFYKDFFKAGMSFINDVFLQNAPVSFTTWVNRGSSSQNELDKMVGTGEKLSKQRTGCVRSRWQLQANTYRRSMHKIKRGTSSKKLSV